MDDVGKVYSALIAALHALRDWSGAEAMMVAHVVPIRLSARDIFVRCAAALVLTPVTLPQAPPVELVQSLFDLTPAEARVARGLASGKTVEGIATDGGTSANTIRTHVRGVLDKDRLQFPRRG
jgi:DNA-binding CsgD family transcriptional regulator